MVFSINERMSSFKQHPQWEAVVFIQKKLKSHGFQVLIAGGAVRDFLLKKQASDIDLVTDARPEDVESFFEKTVMVGRQFGVSRIVVGGHDIEVATFRKDGPYLDGRRPESVKFSSAKEDAMRRDFTINALFYDLEKDQIIDYVGGRKDLEKGIIRTVGSPEQRFHEDKLRMLRALRFHGQLGFGIEEKTFEAVKVCSPLINQVSMERIRDEWGKILVSEFFLSCLQKVRESGLWSVLFPGLDFLFQDYRRVFGDFKSSSVMETVSLKLDGTDTNTIKESSNKCGLKPGGSERFWVLWFLIHHSLFEDRDNMVSWMRTWKLSRQLMKKILFCYRGLSLLKNIREWEPVDMALFLNQPHGNLALEVYQYLCEEPEDFSKKFKKARSFFRNGSLPKPLVNGNDLTQKGLSGPELSRTLKELYRRQIKEGITDKRVLL